MKIVVVGLGYIGLPTSIMFAKQGVEVIGVDVNLEVIKSLNSNKVHIEEPRLQESLEEVIKAKKFKVSSIPESADTFIITVPTPHNDDEYKSMNPSYVLNAVISILPCLNKGNTVIIESTIAPRTTVDLIQPIIEDAGFIIGEDIYLVHCPERVLPGNIMQELVENNRIIGGVTSACTEAGAKVYSSFVKGKIIKTDANTAEMSKLMENTYRDVNIALANELTRVCNELHINALEVIEMANMHPRVNIHSPGPGVGGHCIAVDPQFIVAKAPKETNLIKLARNINSSMPQYVLENINNLMEQVNGKKVTIMGLAYKGNVDDVRQSPAIEIYNILKSSGKYDVTAYDPHVNFCWIEEDIETAVDGSDLIVILTDHDEFKVLDWGKFTSMNHIRVFDTKNIVTNPTNEYVNYGNLHQFVKKEKLLNNI